MYLLLSDGSVREDLPPVPPDEFDAAAEKAGDPKKWGRWKKTWGGEYQLSVNDEAYTAPPGQLLREPGRASERFDGKFSASSGYQIPGGAGAWSRWGIVFTSAGRFRTFKSGGAGGGGFGSDQVTAGVVYDDEGSASSSGSSSGSGGSGSSSGSG